MISEDLTHNSMQLEQQLEALLFYKGEPQKVRDLARALSVSEEVVESGLSSLASILMDRGIRLIREGEYAGLATAPELHAVIENIRKEELEGPLGKAGLETLAIVIYRGPLSKADIEYIRGVNCASILRSLTIRGLIEKIEHPTDRRSFLYTPTPALVAQLGLTSLSEAPDFESIALQLQTLLAEQHVEES